MNKGKVVIIAILMFLSFVLVACEGSGGYDKDFVVDGAIPVDKEQNIEPETVTWSIEDWALMKEYGAPEEVVIVKPVYPIDLETHQLSEDQPFYLILQGEKIIGYWMGASNRELNPGREEYFVKTTKLLKNNPKIEYLFCKCRNGLFLITPNNSLIPFTSYGYGDQDVSHRDMLYENNYIKDAVLTGDIFLSKNHVFAK